MAADMKMAFKEYREALDKVEEAFGLTPVYDTLRASIYKEAICAVISEISQEIYDALEARYCAEKASVMTETMLTNAHRDARGCTEAEAIQIGQMLFEAEAAGRPFDRLDVCLFVPSEEAIQW